MDEPKAASAKRGLHVPSLIVGALVGAVVGCVGGAGIGGTDAPSPPAKGQVVTRADDAAAQDDPGTVVSESPAAPPLTVTVGRGRQSYSFAEFPVTVKNQTGRTLPYLEVRCAFYGFDNGLIASAYTNWTDVQVGETASGEINTDAARVDEILKYECNASAR